MAPGDAVCSLGLCSVRLYPSTVNATVCTVVRTVFLCPREQIEREGNRTSTFSDSKGTKLNQNSPHTNGDLLSHVASK